MFCGCWKRKAIDNSCQFLCEIVGLICERMDLSWLSAFSFPDLKHPMSGKTYRELWGEFDKPLQGLAPVK